MKEQKKAKQATGLQITLLIVGILVLVALILNLAQGGVWIIEGLNGKDGQDGKDGQNGQIGQDGQDGADGKSAYELAVQNGFSGSLHEWLLSLAVQGGMGPAGPAGSTGVGISDVYLDGEGHLMVKLSNGQLIDAGYVGSSDGISDKVDEMGFLETYEIVVKNGHNTTIYLRLSPDLENGEIYTTVTEGDELLRIGIQEDEATGFSRFLYNGVVCYARTANFDRKYQYDGKMPSVNLPASMVLTQNEQTWFITDQIVSGLSPDLTVTYSYTGAGTRVFNGSESFAITPTALGEATLTLTIQTVDEGVLQTVYRQSVAITVVAKKSELALTGLLIGDSRISDGAILSKLKTDLPNLTLLGTRQVKNSGISHEGRGAWSTADYLTKPSVDVAGTSLTNPFYNPATGRFDFTYYMQSSQYDSKKLDFVVLNLGANDGYSADSAKNLNTMVASIQAYAQSKGYVIRIFVMSEYLSPADGYYLQQETNINVHSLRARQFAYFSYLDEQFANREAEGIYLLPNYLSIDSFGDRVTGQIQSAQGFQIGITDVIHLGTQGYYKEAQMIESYLYWLFGAEKQT
ncbi:MAG: hypothetical protein IKB75_01590 [Clostridia bacterium]|nr:hypothetical protein [Clostridia bacterium]